MFVNQEHAGTIADITLKVINSVSILKSHDDVNALIRTYSGATKPVVLSFINAHAYNLCFSHPEFTTALLQSNVILRDGVGMKILFKTIGRDPGANLNGTDYIPVLLKSYLGKKIALLGTEEPYLDTAVQMLSRKGHQIVLSEHGFHRADYYLSLVRNTTPDVIILGMGMPKQEKVSALLKEHLDYNCIIINGGAILDFWGNKVQRAPLWVRQLGMEWLYRLIIEPTRLFSRYVVGNYVFLKRTKILKKHIIMKDNNKTLKSSRPGETIS